MDSTMLLLVSSGIMLLVLLIAFGLPALISRRWNRHRAETVSKWEADGVGFVRGPVGGKFLGLESIGSNKNTTGIGFVVLTDKDLRVTRAAPSGEWRIPFRQIKGVSLHSAFMQQHSKKTPFIIVRFIENGQKDKLGFQVKEAEVWAEALAQAAGVSLKRQVDDD